jgi:hypothetical protein
VEVQFNSTFLAVGCAHTCGMSRNGFLNEKKNIVALS